MAKLPQTSPWRSRAPNLPSIPTPSTEPRQLLRFMEAIKEAIEVREGGRATEHDRYVTFRDLADLGLHPSQLKVGAARPGDVRIALAGGGCASISVGEFETAIKGSRAYADLVKSLNDPTRFDALPTLVREVLLSDLAAEARLRSADIQRLEKKIQDSTQSLAMSVETTTAALGSSLAAVRETTFASATEGQAVAGKVTQIIARLNDVGGEGVTIEEVLYGSATYAGLMGQWSLKINAGGAVAGIVLSAEDDASGPSSALLIQADKFAIVSPSYSGGPTNSPASNLIPFGVDASGVYVNGQLRVNATGPTLDKLATLGGVTAYTVDTSLQAYPTRTGGAAKWSIGSPSTGNGTLADNVARNRIWTILGNGGSAPSNAHLRIGDTVTITNHADPTAATVSVTGYWSGTGWLNPGVTIDGNLLVNGTISGEKIIAGTVAANQIAANAITAPKIAAGAITTDKIDARQINADKIMIGGVDTQNLIANAVSNIYANSANSFDGGPIIWGGVPYKYGAVVVVNAIFGEMLTISFSINGSAGSTGGFGYNDSIPFGIFVVSNVAGYTGGAMFPQYLTQQHMVTTGTYDTGFAVRLPPTSGTFVLTVPPPISGSYSATQSLSIWVMGQGPLYNTISVLKVKR